MESFGVCCHQFADDTQLYIAMNAADTEPALDQLTRWSAAVQQWVVPAEWLTALLSLSLRRSPTVLATRLFFFCGSPTVWNAVRLSGSAHTCRKKLKTALFRTAHA